MNARFYVPGNGRFTSADTIMPGPANPQIFNHYTYTLNNPICYTDPSDHCVFGLPCPEHIERGIKVVSDFTAGIVTQIAHDNALVPTLREDLTATQNESNAMLTGRVVGGLVSTTCSIAKGGCYQHSCRNAWAIGSCQ